MRMRKIFALAFIVLLSGCTQPGLFCPDCDDGNPCTLDFCNQTTVACEHRPLNGEYGGCSETTSCVRKFCSEGACASDVEKLCCGNSACEQGESYLTCARDCKASCSDGIQNEGEFGVDCGGPCMPCQSIDIDSLEGLNSIRNQWISVTDDYNGAIKQYNNDLDQIKLRDSAYRIMRRLDVIRLNVSSFEVKMDFAGLKTIFSGTVNLYYASVGSMINYTLTQDDRYRTDANRLLEDALLEDTRFVEGYNAFVAGYNKRQAACSNGVRDASEGGVDCGSVCGKLCYTVINLTKIVRIDNGGYSTEMVLNITAPAINYPPYQEVVDVKYVPWPNFIINDSEGNVYYVFKTSLDKFQSKEFEVMQSVRINNGIAYLAAQSNLNREKFLSPPKTQPSYEICATARNFLVLGNNTATALNAFVWIRENIVYEANTDEKGAEYCYRMRKGACDEHADLFVAMMRCLNISARRVTGFLINNGTDTSGHAWAEFYDNGWIYVDPSSKQDLRGFITDQKHVITCVGERAYDCGTTYTYTFMQNKRPKINLTEKILLY